MSGKRGRVLTELNWKDGSDDGRDESELASPETDSGVPDVGRPSSANLWEHTTGKALGSSKANLAKGQIRDVGGEAQDRQRLLLHDEERSQGKKQEVEGNARKLSSPATCQLRQRERGGCCTGMQSTHSKGVAAEVDLYNPGTSKSCAGCQASRRFTRRRRMEKMLTTWMRTGTNALLKITARPWISA
jgi:hypothetical protein